jgi:hypothetical protein
MRWGSGPRVPGVRGVERQTRVGRTTDHCHIDGEPDSDKEDDRAGLFAPQTQYADSAHRLNLKWHALF